MGNRRCISVLLRLTESKRKSPWGKDVGVREGTHMFSDTWYVGKSVRMHRAAVKERLRGRQRTSGARKHLPFRWFPLGVLETMVCVVSFCNPKNISGNLLRRVATSVQFTGVPSAVVYWTIVSWYFWRWALSLGAQGGWLYFDILWAVLIS